MDHADADCVVCIFLTHGKEGQISAWDEMINIKEITDPFRGDQCKNLVGKPKIFIFQVTTFPLIFYNSVLNVSAFIALHMQEMLQML